MNYTEKELKDIQKVCLTMATYFVQFCEEHHLLCYLCGGGCIGAIRHKGFIPWDDDLDFFMPRKHYEKLKELWEQYADTRKYSIQKPSKGYNDHNTFITIRDNETTQIKPYQKELMIEHGIAIDIMPLDGYPVGKIKRKLQCFYALLYSLFCAQLVPKNHGKKVELLGNIALGIVKNKTIRYKIWCFAEKRMIKLGKKHCNGITELCAGPGYMKNWYPKEAFKKAMFMEFENNKLPIPIGADAYLKIAFGDYRKLPPKDKRVAHHDCVFLDTKNSYKRYKGIYF